MATFQTYYQCLVGDGADGFPGCPGIGEKKAEEILMTAMEACGRFSPSVLWDVLHFTYLSQGATKEDLNTTWCLVNVRGDCVKPDDVCFYEYLPDDYQRTLTALRS